ncbi:MAG: SusC/RagA family TonB-linked outer membrane protein [Bacteroidales bacterium]|jgi:TonB-linked SusC/RagA family outer membrane protein|nr:SusC/RagA family TonB-linked outer membrane protein [Bacteroidales bacterium]
MQNIKYYMLIACCLFGLTAIKAQNKSGDSLFSFGYYSLPAEAVTTAVETVSGAVLERASTADIGLSLAGRLNGLTTIEISSALTNSEVFKLIRGVSTANGTDPLIIIDGVICPTSNWDYLTAQEIESISILKDGASTAIYGMQGSGGAIIITTKRGVAGKTKIEGYFEQAFQKNVYHPDFISSSKYVALRNQAAANDGLATPLFSQSEVEGFNSGDRKYYPNNDWYSMTIRDWAFMQKAGINIFGGNEFIKYFANLNYIHQSSPIKIADEANRKYDPTPAVNSINFRSNIDLKINDYLSGFLLLSGNVNMEKTSSFTNSVAYALPFMLPPTMYGPLTGDDALLFNEEGTLIEDKNQVVTINDLTAAPYGQLNRAGYRNLLQTSIMVQSGLNLDMSFLTKGLSLSGLIAYQTHSNSVTATVQNYAIYTRDLSQGYNVLRFIRKGSIENTPLVYGKYSQYMYNLNLFAHLDYNRTFGEHSVSAMAYVMSLKRDAEIPTDEAAAYGSTYIGAYILPYNRINSGITATYGYKNRYFIQASLGYTGSDQFARNYRFVTTPAVSAAYIVSNEAFLKGNSVLTFLKLRASYGINANDQLGGNRFMYLDEYDIAGNELATGNPYVTAEKIAKQNYGFDLELFKDLMLRFDYYRTRTDNMLIDGAISMPSYTGIPSYPKLNEGKMESEGVEISLMYKKEFYKDLSFYIGGGLAFNKNKVISINEIPLDTTYKYRYRTEGFSALQMWGYEIDYSNGNGFINTPQELEKAKSMYSSELGAVPRLGDFMYKDVNGDKKIDIKDRVPIGYSRIPQIYYNVNLGFAWKGLEINALFQGTARSSVYVSGIGADESMYEGYFTDIHLNSWTPENQNASYPALSTTTSVSHLANSYFIMNTAYLRLRNLEVAYTLPEKISKHIAAEKIRIAICVQNLFTVSNMRTKYIDPETTDITAFQPYRVFNIKINAIF